MCPQRSPPAPVETNTGECLALFGAGALCGAAALRWYELSRLPDWYTHDVPETVHAVVIEDERGIIGWE